MQQIIKYFRMSAHCRSQLFARFQAKMTQAAAEKKDTIEKEKLQKQKSNLGTPPKYVSDRCIQTAAWILLSVGLSILATTFYLMILAKNKAPSGDEFNKRLPSDQTFLEFNRSTSRIFDSGMLELDPFEGCEEKTCNIACMKTENIFEALHLATTDSPCNTTYMLLIENQEFPNSTLRNQWISVEHLVLELFITACDVTRIRNNAFNTPLFAKTFLLSLYKLQLTHVDSGALLGLYELRYLTIDSKVEELDSAFFQPVQTTLTHLKLTAGLEFQADKCIFGTNNFPKLEYLDLSRNSFSVPLKKKMFLYMPSLKYLTIADSKLTSIEENTFDVFAGKLRMLNLANNKLTTVSNDLMAPLINTKSDCLIGLGGNCWNCDCELQPLVKLYQARRAQFIEPLYCKLPTHLYGQHIDSINYTQEGCNMHNDVSKEVTTASNPDMDSKEDNSTTSAEVDSREENVFLQLRCLDLVGPAPYDGNNSLLLNKNDIFDQPPPAQVVTTPRTMSKISEFAMPNFDDDMHKEIGPSDSLSLKTSDRGYMRVEPPAREFDLHLFPNQSALVSITDFSTSSPVNIVWFSEQLESQILEIAGEYFDYNCVGYEAPFVIIDELVKNTTYTVCIIPLNQYTISPFNCQPLHVPADVQRTENIWISTDQKQFTVGILCLIFLLSLFFGAVIAYFGIKTYPDLLEGSKNVVVVKKSEQTCYVSTISECEYLKQSSLKKKPLNSSKPPLPETPSSLPPPVYGITSKNIERLYSDKSSSTLFEDPFTPISYFAPPIPFKEDEYEMPKSYDKTKQNEVRCVPNNYGMSPGSPPPLPKRNSNISDNTIGIVANRFSKAE